MRSRLTWAGLAAAILFSVFVLPEFVPVPPTNSDSYIFGYSNRTGILLLFAAVAGVAVLFDSRRAGFLPAADARRLPAKRVWLWCAVFAVAWGVMYGLAHGLSGIGESAYLIDRVHMLADGGRPYRDFEFLYGASFLYGPWLVARLGLSIEAGYFAFYLICLLGGVWMLAWTLALLKYPSTHTRRIFDLFCWFALIAVVCTGLNYTLYRFIPAPLFAVLVARVHTSSQIGKRIEAGFLAVLFTAALVLITPEMAMAYGAGMTVYLAVFPRERARGWGEVAPALISGVGAGAVLLGADRLRVFDSLKQFSSGAFSFPIIPAGHILLFIFCLGLVGVFAAHRIRTGSTGDGALAIIAVSAPAVVSALGRCDTGHVGFSGIGILLVAMAIAFEKPGMWRVVQPAYIVLFLVLPGVAEVWNYRSVLSNAAITQAFRREPMTTTRMDLALEHVLSRMGKKEPKEKVLLLKLSSRVAEHLDVSAIFGVTGAVVEAPLGFTPAGLGSYQTPEIDPGYFDGTLSALTRGSIQRKIDELRAHPERELLLPKNYEERCRVDPWAERRLIQVLFFFPYLRQPRHEVEVMRPLCSYIDEHYAVVQEPATETYNYGVWKPR